MTSIRKEGIDLKFAGQTYKVDPTFEVIDAIEQRVGLGQMAQRLQSGDVRISDLAWTVHAALSASGYSKSYSDCGNAILKHSNGITDAAEFVSKLIEAALSSGPAEPLDEDEAAVEGKAKT